MENFDLLQATVKSILEHWNDYSWSLQGLGMLRLYLTKEIRLHVWDAEFAVDRVSNMHTHPWDFESVVIAGQMQNTRYGTRTIGKAMMAQKLLCGEGGGLKDEPYETHLVAGPKEYYNPGDTYRQTADEIHVSTPRTGTVTLVRRHFLPDPDHALVFWEPTEKWVNAEPREATSFEIRTIVKKALERWL